MVMIINIGAKTKNIIVCILKNTSVINEGNFNKSIINNINVKDMKIANNFDTFFIWLIPPLFTG